MTRINAVPVEELTNAHLAVEHYELIRVYRLVRKAINRGEQPDDAKNPDTYRMGKGHVRFFYPRLRYIQRREIQLHVEMLFRGLSLSREEYDTSDIPSSWFQDWTPDEGAKEINRARLKQRIMEYERHMTRGYIMEK